ELVCSNSFRSDDAQNNAVGLLHKELRAAGSLIMKTADAHQVPAGGALAVDRENFAKTITETLQAHSMIKIEREEITTIPPTEWDNVIIATGPLTSPEMAKAIQTLTGEDSLAFFDAIAPILYKESIDFEIAWFQSRYDKEGPGGTGADYINLPMNRTQYEEFIFALLHANTIEFKEWEKKTPYFEGCLPIETMAARGLDTLRHGPMKPVGLTNPHKPEEKPHAVVQLRQDNTSGTLYNIVGFQTKMKYGAQKDLFRSIQGLEKAEFARLGGLHRNTFINSPELLDRSLSLKSEPRLRFAGQITGCEGYVESTAIGLIAGWMACAERRQQRLMPPPATTAMGALLHYITGEHISKNYKKQRSFQPMNINFGLFPAVEIDKKKKSGSKKKGSLQKQEIIRRADKDFNEWLSEHSMSPIFSSKI
ncbi:MAG: methylenetetrahydrofolate--tRNA-(uracil(54)-C(5))-methyltransferase (FADH(2)-oxidizing) TrmFO, partial [Alphaproteobacteria bacterium]|nr:methylenetetrahydrofolate--tRNA-(uracil(54)-C(5))-methyltransferase (FADH(2)-oxidizing) TrmFO [Alphaproteobacteria bacterium]